MTRLIPVFLLASAALIAAPPVLNTLEPGGAQRGKALTLTLIGANLPEGAKIVSNLPATFTPLSVPPETAGKRLPFLVEIQPGAPVGLYPVRIESPNGISNILLFSLGSYPEMREMEKNDTMETAQPLKALPITINGTFRAGDRDFFKVYGKGGEHRIFEVEARRMGSAIDPALNIYDSNGKLLIRIEDTPTLGVDCRLDFTFPQEGNYYVEVHDARFSDQAANFYRLKMGFYSYADAVFPLGWTRDKPIDVELSGGNLTAPVKAKPTHGMVSLPNSEGTLPIPFVLSDSPETLEPAGAGPHILKPGTVMNGRLLKPGEIDKYRLAVKPGETYMIDLGARGLGTSRLDALLTIYDSKGEKLDSAGDQPPKQAVNATFVAGDFSTDPFLLLKAPPGVTEVIVAVEDLNQDGGPAYAYRLSARQQQPGFELTLATPFVNIPAGGSNIVTVNVERRGFNGDVFLKVENLPPGIEAAGGSVPAEVVDIDARTASRRGVITLTAKHGVKAQSVNLTVWGEATLPDGSKMRRKATAPGMTTNVRGNFGFVDSSRRNVRPFQAFWLGLDLPAAVSGEPPGVLTVNSPPRVRIVQGMKYEFPWSFASKTGVPSPRTVAFDTPGGRDLRISEKDKVLTMNTTLGTTPGIFDVILSARTGAAMREEIVYAPAITVEVVQGYHVEAPKQATPLKPGGKVELVGGVSREAGFTSPITIAPDALPLAVTCVSAEVPDGAKEYRIACEAGPDAPAGDHKILLNPSSILPEGEKGKVPYKIGAVEASLVVAK
ncbi:MAG TPA: hypothetical protein VM120_19685 [Bryobacteraceae bacterium]|nr:hypothetical protein [Bryobacteraceae bacterium]